MDKKKYLSLGGLQEYDALLKAEILALINSKVDTDHDHDDRYYTKTEINNFELITTDDIDAICGSVIQMATANEVAF